MKVTSTCLSELYRIVLAVMIGNCSLFHPAMFPFALADHCTYYEYVDSGSRRMGDFYTLPTFTHLARYRTFGSLEAPSQTRAQ